MMVNKNFCSTTVKDTGYKATRREIVTKCGAGLAAIIAAGRAPAAFVRSMVASRNTITPASSSAPPLPYDAEVEYLGGDGSAYMLTPWNPGGTISTLRSAEVSVELSLVGTTATTAFGVMGFNFRVMGFGLRYYPNNYRLQALPTIGIQEIGDSWYWQSGPNARHTITLSTPSDSNATMFMVDGELVAKSANSTSIARIDAQFPLFAYSTIYTDGTTPPAAPSLPADAGIRIRRFTVPGVCDLKPVRVGATGFMFDTISGLLVGNAAGVGAFRVGPDL